MLALAIALTLAAGPDEGGSQLTITVWPRGTGESASWTLRCDPPAGNLPQASKACRTLASLEEPFVPTPPETVCIQIYGGPQRALVRGTYRGRRVWARFARRDGCEIARWRRHAALFPVKT